MKHYVFETMDSIQLFSAHTVEQIMEDLVTVSQKEGTDLAR